MELDLQNLMMHFIWSFCEKVMASETERFIVAIEFWSLNFNTLYILNGKLVFC